MDVAVILTYRCNSKCSMCNIWKYPTHPQDEISLETLDKIPYGVDYLNLTGGEPTLRNDLPELIAYAESKGQITGLNTNVSRSGGGQSHNNMQPYLAVSFCIALQGLFPTRN